MISKENQIQQLPDTSTLNSISLPDDSAWLPKFDNLPSNWSVILSIEEEVIAKESAQKLTLSHLKQEITQQKSFLAQLEAVVSLDSYAPELVSKAQNWLEELQEEYEDRIYHLKRNLDDLTRQTTGQEQVVETKKRDLQALLDKIKGIAKERENAQKVVLDIQQKYDQAGDDLKGILQPELDRAKEYLKTLSAPSYESNMRAAAEKSYKGWREAMDAVHDLVVSQDNIVRVIQKCEKRLAYLMEHRNALIEAYIKQQVATSTGA